MAHDSNKELSINTQSVEKVWNKTFVLIFTVNFIIWMGQFMLNTIIPKYVTHIGVAAENAGLIISLLSFAALALRPISGPSIDTFHKKKVLLAAIGMITVAFFLYGIVPSVFFVVVARLVHGCGMGFLAATALAIASDSLPPNKLASGIGYFSLGQALATAIGPSVGLSMISSIGYSYTFMISTAVMASAGLLALTLKIPAPREKKTLKISLDRMIAKEALLPAVLILFISMSYSSIMSYLVLFAESRNVMDIGLYYTVYALAMLVSRPMSGLLCDRYGSGKIFLPAMIFFALGMLTISLSTQLWMFLVAAVFVGLGFGCCSPIAQTLAVKSVSPERRGVGGSTNFIGFDVGFLMGPMLAGWAVGAFGYATMFQLTLIPIGISILLLLFNRNRIKQIECVDK